MIPNAQASTSKTASVWVRIPLMPDEGMIVQLAETADKNLSCNFVGMTWGHRPIGGHQTGSLGMRVQFPLVPPMSRSSKKTGIPEDTALSGGDEGENPSLLSNIWGDSQTTWQRYLAFSGFESRSLHHGRSSNARTPRKHERITGVKLPLSLPSDRSSNWTGLRPRWASAHRTPPSRRKWKFKSSSVHQVTSWGIGVMAHADLKRRRNGFDSRT
jgi:hypothetical protein